MHKPKSEKQYAFRVMTNSPYLKFTDGTPVLTFTFSSLLDEEQYGLNQVLNFAERVHDFDVKEIVLDICVDLDAIVDDAIDNARRIDLPRDGFHHVSSDYKSEFDAARAALVRAIGELDKIQYHDVPEKPINP